MCKISLFRHTKYFYKFLIHPSSLIHLSWGSEEFFNVGIFSTEELKMSKVYPETFLKMAEIMNVSPEDCAVFEDAPYAAQSAAEAGCQVYGIWDLESTAAEVEKCAKRFIRGWNELL